MERPFDYDRAPQFQIRTAATCAAEVRECIAYIRKHNLAGERLATWQQFIRDWRRAQRDHRKSERRA